MFKREVVGKSLYEFEDQCFEAIKTLQLFGYNAWQIVKYPLYWELITQDEQPSPSMDQAGTPGSPGKLSAQLNKIPELLKLSYSLARLYGRKGLTLFYAHSVDKAFNAEKGLYFNGLVDPLITNGIVTDYIYAETPQEGKYKDPSLVKRDFKAHELLVLSSFIRIFSRQRAKVKQLADQLHRLLEAHFANAGIEVRLSAAYLESILAAFCSEYQYSILFLKIARPALIITSERLGSGLLAAAKKLSIPSVDLQHGLIDQYHAQYIYVGKMRAIKGSLAIPSYLGVFGRLHKDVLLYDGFWAEQDVVILGNSRIQDNRAKYMQGASAAGLSGTGEKTILIPTQKTTFRELTTLLETLIAGKETGEGTAEGRGGAARLRCKIILKLHPLEPPANVEVYSSLAARKPDLIILAARESNTYELMMKARLVVGFDSAVLLESVSMVRPCITLTTDAAPKGIHGFYPNGGLEDAIIPVKVGDVTTLIDLINRVMEDDAFYGEWIKKLDIYSDNLYSKDYLQNCRNFINSVFP